MDLLGYDLFVHLLLNFLVSKVLFIRLLRMHDPYIEQVLLVLLELISRALKALKLLVLLRILLNPCVWQRLIQVMLVLLHLIQILLIGLIVETVILNFIIVVKGISLDRKAV
jgi:hypothetical protein